MAESFEMTCVPLRFRPRDHSEGIPGQRNANRLEGPQKAPKYAGMHTERRHQKRASRGRVGGCTRDRTLICLRAGAYARGDEDN